MSQIATTIFQASWSKPATFTGTFEITEGQHRSTYQFRAELQQNAEPLLTFTRLSIAKSATEELADFGPDSLTAYTILGYALEKSIELLHQRALARFQAGLASSPNPESLIAEELGFQVTIPLNIQDPATSSAFHALLFL